MYDKILVAVDGSETSRLALEEATRLARLTHSTVLAVSVLEHETEVFAFGNAIAGNLRDDMRAGAHRILEEASKHLAKNGVSGRGELVESQNQTVDIATTLEQHAEAWGADLVVLGTHGRRGIRRMILGSVAERFVRQSSCPVLLVRSRD